MTEASELPQQASGGVRPPVARLTQLQIQNFRGWGSVNGAPHAVDLDAEVVLLTGANGRGKTSLLEAVLLLLTRHRAHSGPSGSSPSWRDLLHGGAQEWSLRVHGARVGEDSVAAITGLRFPPVGGLGQPADQPEETVPEGHWWAEVLSVMDPGDQAGQISALLGRVVAFFQEDPRGNLDSEAADSALDAWVKPVSPLVRDALERAHVQRRELAQERERTQRERDASLPGSLVEGWDGWTGALRRAVGIPTAASLRRELQVEGLCEEVLRLAEELRAEDLPAPAEVAAVRERLAACVAGGEPREAARRDAVKAVDAAVEALRTRALELVRRGVAGEIAALNRELGLREADLQKLLPEQVLVERLAWTGDDEAQHGGPASDEVLRALGDRVGQWLRGLEQAGELHGAMAALRDELRRLDSGKLQSLARGVGEALASNRMQLEQRKKLETEVAQLTEKRDRLAGRAGSGAVPEAHALLKALRDEAKRLDDAAKKPTDPAYARALRWIDELTGLLKDRVSPEGDDEHSRKVDELIHMALDNTLVRFKPRAGFLPVRRRRDSTGGADPGRRILRTGDDRPWTDASTGQKAQLSLAWMLAQAVVLQGGLPFRVLILDDTSTAFDQGNLARQATWLRQLAYHPDPKKRWQILLSSHHDELTSRLVELLRPPDGMRLRVLDFQGWHPEKGPEVDTYLLEPKPPAARPEARLEQALKILWTRPTEHPHGHR